MIRLSDFDLIRALCLRCGLALAALFLLSACATRVDRRALPPASFHNPDQSVFLSNQLASGWGKHAQAQATIQSAFTFWNCRLRKGDVPPFSLSSSGFVRALFRAGVPQGLWVSGTSGSMGHLESVVASGVPVIAFVLDGNTPGAELLPWLVVGFDAEQRVLAVHEGKRRLKIIEYDHFSKAWMKSRQFMITVVPAEKADWLMTADELQSLAGYWRHKGGWEKADQAYRAAETIAPEDIQILYGRAGLWEQAGDLRRAELVYRQILAGDELQSRAANNLAHLLIEQQVRFQEALKLATRAVTMEPDNPVFLATLGSALAAAGQMAEAVQAYEKAHYRARSLEVNQQREIVASLARLYQKTGQPHLVSQIVGEYLLRDPGFDFQPTTAE